MRGYVEDKNMVGTVCRWCISEDNERERQREYHKRPEVRERRRKRRKRADVMEYHREYRKRPEAKEYMREYMRRRYHEAHPEARTKHTRGA